VSQRDPELPPNKERLRRRAVVLEFITIAYMLSAILFIALAAGASQTMKAVFVEDTLSLVPPIAVLWATRVRRKRAEPDFPYGHHRATSIAYLCGSVALLLFGLFILADSLLKLITAEHPTVGTVVLFGHQLWLGWPMMAALIWSGIPAMMLGRIKLPIARELHDKALYADAEMNRADWLSATAGVAGIAGIGFGLWWADGVVASIIAFEIARDGFTNVKQVAADLMDHVPTSVDHKSVDPLPARVETEMRKLPWVREAKARLREEGHVYFGEVHVVPSHERDLLANIERAHDQLRQMDWRLHDIVIAPAREIHDELKEAERTEGSA
jgi:cation diffusion facilitator family transporter